MKLRSLGSPTAPCFLMRYRGVTLLLDTGVDFSALLDFLPRALSHGSIFEEHVYSLAPGGVSSPLLKQIRSQTFLDMPWMLQCACLLDPSSVPIGEIDVVLISTADSLVALPFLVADPSFRALILASEPTLEMGRELMTELAEYLSRGGAPSHGMDATIARQKLVETLQKQSDGRLGSLPPRLASLAPFWRTIYSADQISESLARVSVVGNNQHTNVLGLIRVTSFSSGYALGSCGWNIEGNSDPTCALRQPRTAALAAAAQAAAAAISDGRVMLTSGDSVTYETIIYLARASAVRTRHPLPLAITATPSLSGGSSTAVLIYGGAVNQSATSGPSVAVAVAKRAAEDAQANPSLKSNDPAHFTSSSSASGTTAGAASSSAAALSSSSSSATTTTTTAAAAAATAAAAASSSSSSGHAATSTSTDSNAPSLTTSIALMHMRSVCAEISSTLHRGGRVLLPMALTSPSACPLDLLPVLADHLQRDFPNADIPILLVAPSAPALLAFANIYGDWLNPRYAAHRRPLDEPFVHLQSLIRDKRLLLFPSCAHPSFRAAFTNRPMVVLCAHPSLRFADAVHFIDIWGHSSRNVLIHTDPDYPLSKAIAPFPSLAMRTVDLPIDFSFSAADLQDAITQCRPKHVYLPQESTVHIEGTIATATSTSGTFYSAGTVALTAPTVVHGWTATDRTLFAVPIEEPFVRATVSGPLASQLTATAIGGAMSLTPIHGQLITHSNNTIELVPEQPTESNSNSNNNGDNGGGDGDGSISSSSGRPGADGTTHSRKRCLVGSALTLSGIINVLSQAGIVDIEVVDSRTVRVSDMPDHSATVLLANDSTTRIKASSDRLRRRLRDVLLLQLVEL